MPERRESLGEDLEVGTPLVGAGIAWEGGECQLMYKVVRR